MKILFVVPCTPHFPSGIVRVEQYFPFLNKTDIDYHWINFNTPRVQRWLYWLDHSIWGRRRWSDFIFRVAIHLSGFPYRWLRMAQILWLAKKVDLIFLQAVLPPAWFDRLLSRLNPHMVFDYDDALYVGHAARTQAVIQSSWRVLAGSQVLLNYARQFNPHSILLPSSVPLASYPPLEGHPVHAPIRLGWIGGISTLEQLRILEEPIKRLVEKGYHFELLIAGSKQRTEKLPNTSGIPIIKIPEYKGTEIPGLVKQFDIGVMPLFDTARERGKCGMKAIIYMAGGLPVVSSPVGAANDIICDGQNGFLAATSAEWVDKLETLMTDPALRAHLGTAGYKTVQEGYSDEVCFRLLNQELFQPIRSILNPTQTESV